MASSRLFRYAAAAFFHTIKEEWQLFFSKAVVFTSTARTAIGDHDYDIYCSNQLEK